MIDIHSHLIYGADDGPKTIDESLRMIYEAEEAGVKVIIATPHFRENCTYLTRAIDHFQEISARTSHLDTELLLGCEVQIGPYVLKEVEEGKRLTLGNSKYMLMELPFYGIPAYSKEIIYRLQLKNINIILAHPERNMEMVENMQLLLEFINMGCLIQVDAASIVGFYGANVKSFAKRLIYSDLVDFVASDAHCATDYSEQYLKAYRIVMRWVGEENADRIFINNGKEVFRLSGESNLSRFTGNAADI